MASSTQTLSGMLKLLREAKNAEEKCIALTYIRGNASISELTDVLKKEDKNTEICRLIIGAFASDDQIVHHEAYITLNVILCTFKSYCLNLFQTLFHIDRRNRVKVFQFLEVTEDSAVIAAARDTKTVDFLNDCVHSIQPDTMEWLAPASKDSSQLLIGAENRALTDDQQLEEQLVTFSLGFMQRLYKISSTTPDSQIERFDNLIMKKVMVLAYMGYKRQRGPAIKLLQQAVANNLGSRIRTSSSDTWLQYKSVLQSTYCSRMFLLVGICDPDWAVQWITSIQLLATDLHRGAGLINNLLSVEEKAFKSTDTVIRRQAFLSWKLLIDNFALDPHELATARRVKLLCIPLNAKNSKTESMALTKLEVWWHLIIKLYENISKFVNPVLTQFLNFCFGPLGDTPLLSTKVDVAASPGKRFLKTNVVAIDALIQLIVKRKEDLDVVKPVLKERLRYAVSDAIFLECYKSFVHSIGEALLILSHLHDEDVANRQQLGRILWTNLVDRVKSINLESKKIQVYKDVMLVIEELGNHVQNKLLIRNLFLDVILLGLVEIPSRFIYRDISTVDFISKFTTTAVLSNINKDHYDAIKYLLWEGLKPAVTETFLPTTLQSLNGILNKILSIKSDSNNDFVISELWCIIAEVATQYTESGQEINEGNAAEHKLDTIKSIINFPFIHVFLEDSMQIKKIADTWKELYTQFDLQADLITTVKPNEIVTDITIMIQDCLSKDKRCCSLAVYCLDALLNSINYKCLLVQDEVPSVVRLISDLSTITLSKGQTHEAESALKALSAMLITVYGHDPQKVVLYLEVVKPAIELMLTPQTEDNLIREIANTWETLVSIFKGLNNMLTVDLLSSYQEAIALAIHHSNSEIEAQALSILKIQDNLEDNAKALLEELAKEIKKSSSKRKYVVKGKDDKSEKSGKHARLVGSFLNRKSVSPKPVIGRSKEKEERKMPLPPEPDSQEYVLIKSDFKLDAKRLTEHQKESLKRRRDDIPAMCNDLSQSSSQDTQNLQMWFDRKINQINKTDKEQTKDTVDSDAETIVDYDANKENNASSGSVKTEVSDKSTLIKNDVTPMESEDENMTTDAVCNNDDNQKKDTIVEASNVAEVDLNKNKTEGEEEDSTKENISTNASVIPLQDDSFDSNSEKLESSSQVDPSVAKKLDFESREEYPDGKEADQRVSPSIIEGAKRRGRKSGPKTASLAVKSEGSSTLQEKQDGSQANQKSIRTRGRPKGQTIQQTPLDDNKQNIKRKAASDSETEGSVGRRQRRKTILPPSEVPSDTDSIKSTESEQSSMSMNVDVPVGQEGLSQRTKHEIARLRINMVFDGPLPSRRRSKMYEETANMELRGKRQITHESSGIKLRSGDIKSGESSKKTPKYVEKEVKTESQDQSKRRTRRSMRHDVKDVEPVDVEASEISTNDTTTVTKKTVLEEQKSKIKKHVKDKSETVETKAFTKSDVPEDNPNDTLVPAVVLDEVKTEISEEKEKGAEDNSDLNASSTGSNATDNLEQVEQHQLIDISNNDECHTVEEEKPQDQDDSEDIVESSQDSNNSSVLEKKCSSRKCFIKINKIQNLQLGSVESTIVKTDESAKESTADKPEVYKESNKEIPKQDDTTHREIVEIPVDDNLEKVRATENVEPESIQTCSAETQKSHEPSSSTKSSLDVSSPKSNTKRLSKLKIFPPQGRGAHMLDLVTKRSLTEGDGQNVRTDDDSVTCKKSKSKDTDNDTKKDKVYVFKEADKIESPSGSRQEKMFNNMKSIDYCTSPPPKLFSNLKNDGEKISLKVDKNPPEFVPTETDQSKEKENNDNVSPSTDKEDLPILEWSNANPPSLTASPSVSILKRHHQSLQDTDSENATPSKRKRVSFADPPVSQEMGYETTLSPYRMNKLNMIRLSLARKEPFKLKPTKLKIIQTDLEKTEKNNELQGERANEIDYQCEKENEMLTKIADDLECENMEMEVETEMACSTADIISQNNNLTITASDNALASIEMTDLQIEETIDIKEETTIKDEQEDVRPDISKEKNNTSERMKGVVTEDFETQQDMFSSMNICDNSHKVLINEFDVKDSNEGDTSMQNNGDVDPLKLNINNDSFMDVIKTEDLLKEKCKPEVLEDTVDIQDMTGLNSTTTSDEILCSVPVRTSTQTSNITEEMDTLPVTDSVFASLPLSQESQSSTQNTAELTQSESLDSAQPIYSILVGCHEPIGLLIGNLANPLWVSQLSTYFSNRGVETVGDLAQLSEREVNRIPVKGNSKVDLVRNVLRQFENTRLSSPQASTTVPALTPEQSIFSTAASTPLIETRATQYVKIAPKNILSEPSDAVFNSASVQKTYSTSQYLKRTPIRMPSEMLVSAPPSIETRTFQLVHTSPESACSMAVGSVMLNTPSTIQYVEIPHAQSSPSSFAPMSVAPMSVTPMSVTPMSVAPASVVTPTYRYLPIAPKSVPESVQSTFSGSTFSNAIGTGAVCSATIGTSAMPQSTNVAFAKASTSSTFTGTSGTSTLSQTTNVTFAKASTSSTSVITCGTSALSQSTNVTIAKASTSSISAGTCGTSALSQNTNVTFAKASTSSTSAGKSDHPPRKASKSVSVQMALEDLLDEIDVNLVLQSAVRRAMPEHILSQYKIKMKHMADSELERETLRMLGFDPSLGYDVSLKTICRACGVNKVLIRLPDIFSADKQFFVKVLNAYRKKIKVSDCLSGLDFTELKEAVCQRCTSSELAEMLSKSLKEEENRGITKPMTELSSLNAMLKRMPMDLIISHTVANEEVIPAPLVLDIALQNNSPIAIARTLQSQSVSNTKSVFNELCTIDTLVSHIQETDLSEEHLLDIFKAISTKLGPARFLNAFHTTMTSMLPHQRQDHSST